ncbi:MAG TPA: hypothetical protein VK737_00445 [Opitutales bacterium]|jgi:hypothetical protein|nr:hypothetical protein [Opitutales bacterium]
MAKFPVDRSQTMYNFANIILENIINPMKSNQQKSNKVLLGVCLVITVVSIGMIGTFLQNPKNETQNLADQIAGPNSIIVRKINALNIGNADQVGYNDGLQDFATAVRTCIPQNPMGYRADLKQIGDGKNALFNLISQNSDSDHVYSSTLDAYRNGWNRGYNQGMASTYY